MKNTKAIVLGMTLLLNSVAGYAADKFPMIMTYKSPTCGCCSEWIKHMEDNGFQVMAHDVQDMGKYKQKANLPYGTGSCHTSFVGGYAIEGHVPASDVVRLLTEKPDFRGITVPGMPMGSPGMEYGDQKDAYQTIAYKKDGSMSVFASH
ncbi:DUF411 domain-containing protein [Endozoicomonas elysicola]|uniref:Metal-binding protein n=1 Tax=Endozoicomonas elysicola TaxID=305900 RepID=A0A081K9W7_9GAMM|nr:DUF411 domain-containing protein [Endozoicomonas elysicola]KEI70943.1 hypothetical protein GV64_09515 [Endozoicomonas elysicola]